MLESKSGLVQLPQPGDLGGNALLHPNARAVPQLGCGAAGVGVRVAHVAVHRRLEVRLQLAAERLLDEPHDVLQGHRGALFVLLAVALFASGNGRQTRAETKHYNECNRSLH